jgi:hypothetical protein
MDIESDDEGIPGIIVERDDTLPTCLTLYHSAPIFLQNEEILYLPFKIQSAQQTESDKNNNDLSFCLNFKGSDVKHL